MEERREDLNGATGASDMAGKAAKVAVELCGKQPRYNEEQRGRSLRSRREKAFERSHRALLSLAAPGDVKPAHDASSEKASRQFVSGDLSRFVA